jgi:hypothetical protein
MGKAEYAVTHTVFHEEKKDYINSEMIREITLRAQKQAIDMLFDMLKKNAKMHNYKRRKINRHPK